MRLEQDDGKSCQAITVSQQPDAAEDNVQPRESSECCSLSSLEVWLKGLCRFCLEARSIETETYTACGHAAQASS